jgi:hypothetical protein
MGIAWMSWNTPYTGEGDDNLGILNTDGTRIAAQLTIVNPLLYHPKRGVRSHESSAKDPTARREQSAK